MDAFKIKGRWVSKVNIHGGVSVEFNCNVEDIYRGRVEIYICNNVRTITIMDVSIYNIYAFLYMISFDI